MGNVLGGGGGANGDGAAASGAQAAARQRLRRKRSLETDAQSEEEVEELSPRRKKIVATSTYIYETLFKRGVNSDITISALGKEWQLHKLYLSQSSYFSSMFSGNWKESDESHITLNIPDPNITTEALDTAFSSLYRDEVHLSSEHIRAIIAAATMLQMDGLLQHCAEFIRSKMDPNHIVQYLLAASLYGMYNVEKECKEWLEINLLKSYNVHLLKDLTIELLVELLKSPDLYVMQVEMDVYTLAKRWLYLVLNREWSGDEDKLLEIADKYFKGQNWLFKEYRKQWLKMLAVDQRIEPGPVGMSLEHFKACSMRCGRVLLEPGEYCWRWTGFTFGVDVLVTFNSSTGVAAVKRNTRSQPCVSAVSLAPRRTIKMRLRMASHGEDGGIVSKYDTGVVQINLVQDEEYSLLSLGPNVQFPLYVSVNLILTSNDPGTD